MPKSRRMKPQKGGGKIESVKIGPQWTRITIVLNTERLRVQVQKAAGKKG